MIYEIKGSAVHSAVQLGARFISNSANGSKALVQLVSPIDGIDIISKLDETTDAGKLQLTAILNSAEWRQPCKNCEI
jgi:hypothetical protein